MELPPAKQKGKIFIVDDHPLVREWLTSLINRQSGLAVCGEAANAPEAMQKLADSQPDVAVVDISLKGPSGIELIKELKQRFPEILVLVLSMHEESSYLERALKAGANGYVMKQEAARKVIEAIRRVLAGGFYASDDAREMLGEMLAARLVAGKTPASQPSVELFSDREWEVFELLAEGKNAIQIAEELRIDVKTVHTYCARMREKLQLSSTAQLLREAFRWHEAHQ
ncbi:MAG: response regulator transcription factor [Verrucomicrobiota bacterium]|jgi:DNA-binding NarL/FixJ family response regulator